MKAMVTIMSNESSNHQIFTYDKQVEAKSGALTMLILSSCTLFFPVVFFAIAAIFISLIPGLLKNMLSIPIADGAEIQQLYRSINITYVLLAIGFLLVCFYATTALWQLLQSYVLLENGTLIKLKWNSRPTHTAGSYAAASTIGDYIPSSNTHTTYRTLTKVRGLIHGIDNIQSPKSITEYIDGVDWYDNITCFPLSNITVVKKTKSKIVIMADTMVKGKPKRKKMKIYCMYHDMDTLYKCCGGGDSIVNC